MQKLAPYPSPLADIGYSKAKNAILKPIVIFYRAICRIAEVAIKIFKLCFAKITSPANPQVKFSLDLKKTLPPPEMIKHSFRASFPNFEFSEKRLNTVVENITSFAKSASCLSLTIENDAIEINKGRVTYLYNISEFSETKLYSS